MCWPWVSVRLFTFFSNGVTWALGCNRAAAEAAMEGELPRIFALESKKLGTPIGAAVLMGLVSTFVLVLYGFMSGSNEDLFWSLFAFSAVIFLLPYEGMLMTFVKMRIIDPDHPRPYRVPGGLGCGARLTAWACFAVLGTVHCAVYVYARRGHGVGRCWPAWSSSPWPSVRSSSASRRIT